AASAERLGPPQRAEKGLPKEVMLIGGGILAALLVIDLLLLILMIVLLVRVGRLRRELRKKDD
ncbi:MAG: hypothetical protein ACYTFO_03930, partial [Planctomycetota bacterium]